MQITRTKRHGVVVSLVAMVDVLMIMLVFFMVTSTYLDLDMIPVAETGEDTSPQTATDAEATRPIMLRIGADGRSYLGGRAVSVAGLSEQLSDIVRHNPAVEVLVLPSGQADVQALVSVMDSITQSGVTRMRIIRLEARP
ncbi:ExbD/TolR family protein [Meridianimarinicoccus aquatilis]|uniref:Biopolymer transporter ExbD n=1 Tax=Meridianimarinicoccus aquatilis TaxID=2552766 RepID=A0A4R6AUD0_9RHOB|nr:biopolymer transporter ExbD [Fluviibacterium aquatile]QIE43490.1 biopolymer transporter ExbD [Rhodobacteraceae bacterium SC52]TDL85493.1 biopolymer transporter ExbD [Fluviibacterium aquatile]